VLIQGKTSGYIYCLLVQEEEPFLVFWSQSLPKRSHAVMLSPLFQHIIIIVSSPAAAAAELRRLA
jgi:hypothetical protein